MNDKNDWSLRDHDCMIVIDRTSIHPAFFPIHTPPQLPNQSLPVPTDRASELLVLVSVSRCCRCYSRVFARTHNPRSNKTFTIVLQRHSLAHSLMSFRVLPLDTHAYSVIQPSAHSATCPSRLQSTRDRRAERPAPLNERRRTSPHHHHQQQAFSLPIPLSRSESMAATETTRPQRESVAWSRPSIPPFLRTNNNSDSASLALSAISVSSTHQPHQHTTHRAPPASRACAGDYGRRANDGHEICGFPFQALWASLLGSPHDFVGHAKIKALPRVLSLFTPLP